MIPKTPENYRLLAMHVLKEKLDTFFSCYERFSYGEMNHIANVAASVMMTRDKVLPGGGFAQAIVSNDLHGAFARADSIIVRSIRFMVHVMYYVRFDVSHPIFEAIETN